MLRILTIIIIFSRFAFAYPSLHNLIRRQESTLIDKPNDKRGKYCGRSFLTTHLTDDNNLWVFGGLNIYHRTNTSNDPPNLIRTTEANKQVWQVDLSKSWKTVDGPSLIYNETLPSTDIISRLGGVAAFQREHYIMTFGGERADAGDFLTPPRVFTFDLDIARKDSKSNPWSWFPVEGLNSRAFGSSAVDGDGNAYYLGGYTGYNDDPSVDLKVLGKPNYINENMAQFTLNGLTTTATSTNISNSNFNAYGTYVAGTMNFIPSIGKSGVFVSIGGSLMNSKGLNSWNWSRIEQNYVDIKDISIFDIDSKIWHRQRATGGDIARRRHHCTILQSAPDNSSHHLYVYGGEGLKGIFPGDIWVLSIPAFQWTRVDSTKVDLPRKELNCEKINRQLLVIGGTVSSVEDITDGKNKTYDPASCDSSIWSVFDTTTHKWSDNFDPQAQPFELNQELVDIMGGTPQGNATTKEPITGWSNDRVRAVFAQKSETTNLPQPTSPKSKGKIGPIVGGVVGGIALIALIAAALFFYKRKYHLHEQPNVPERMPMYQAPVHHEALEPSGMSKQGPMELPGQQQYPSELSRQNYADTSHPVELPGHGMGYGRTE